MPHSSSIGLGQLVSSGGPLTNVLVATSPPTSPRPDTSVSNLDNLDNLATRKDNFEVNVLCV